MRDLYSLFFHYHPLFFRCHHWHAWELQFSALYVPEFMHSWQHGQTHETLCSRGQHYSLQEQTGLFKPKPETAIFPRYSSHAIEQVLQELDVKTSSIQPPMNQQYSKRHCFNDSVRMWVWNKHCGSKSTFFMSFDSLWRSFIHAQHSVVVWFDAQPKKTFDFHENEEKQQWLSRGVTVQKQLERTQKHSDTSL